LVVKFEKIWCLLLNRQQSYLPSTPLLEIISFEERQ
jgi:hypothetical protein